MNAMVAEGGGLLFYLRMDGRGAGLAAKVAATSLEVEGMDTWRSRVHLGVNPDSRSFTPIGKYLAQRNYKAVRLLTNNPIKVRDLASEGISVQTLGIAVPHPNQQVLSLYRTKVNQFGHSIELSDKQ
jgi:GTP cyclohydrolase II